MMEVNFLAVLTAAVLAFILGGIWYSAKVFGNLWSKHAGNQVTKEKHKAWVFIISFVFYFISAWAFAVLLGPAVTLSLAVSAGFAIGLLFVAMCFGINYLFAGRSIVLLLIDGGYHILQFVVYGAVFGLWH